MSQLLLNPLMPDSDKKVTHTYANLQLKAKRPAAGCLSMCDLFFTTRHKG